MKECFDSHGVKTCKWWDGKNNLPDEINFPLVAKLKNGSRGRGMIFIENQEQLDNVGNNSTFETVFYRKY